MAFSQSGFADLRVIRDGAELHVAWTAATFGAIFQVYVDRRLSWCGLQQFCNVPIPADAAGRDVLIEVGIVGTGEMNRDYSGALSGPGGSGNRAQLTWYGGTYLDPSGNDDVGGYRVYTSAHPGGFVDYGSPICSIPAYPAGILTDGYGMGGFGQGGFGRASSLYKISTGSLRTGTWSIAVVPYDKVGNAQSTPQITSISIEASPRPPAAYPDGSRLTYTYSGPVTRTATLNWLPTPS
jgi:hypothetical protein